MQIINLDEYKDEMGYIDLYRAWCDNQILEYGVIDKPSNSEKVREFFNTINGFQNIRSTQVAALALAIAELMKERK